MMSRLLKQIALCIALSLGGAAPAVSDVVEATTVLRAGQLVRAVDVRLADKEAPGGIPAVEHVVGREIISTIYPGHVLRPSDLRAPTMIDRNQIVEMIYRDRGLTLRSEGRALDRGAMGDLIRVMNLASRETVTGRVTGPGKLDMSR